MTTLSGLDELRALANLVSDSVKQIEESCTARNVSFPSLSSSFTSESEAARMDPAVSQASVNIVAAAAQLTALVRSPQLTIATKMLSFHTPSVLRYVIDTNTVEILREAGPKGLHVNKIAEQGRTNANKLSRALRLLATEHIFTEVAPDVFTNNRISSLLDTGKSVAVLSAKPDEKYVDTKGVAALVTHCIKHGFKASAYLTETLRKPDFVDSFDVAKSPFNVAFKTDLPIWEWFEQPGNEAELQLFSQAMTGSASLSPQNVILNGFDWAGLPKGSVVVDVAGGVGSQSLLVARAHPHLKFVIQDRDATIVQAQQFWKEQFPEAVSNGTVAFEARDLFASQPIENASIFIMRMILHDWADLPCEAMLRQLRASARPDTQLLLIDAILAHACAEDTPASLEDVPSIEAPKPLLPNAGHASAFKYMSDLQMMTMLNGQERTLDQLNKLLVNSGWKLSRVFRTPYFATDHQQVLAIPA